MTSLLPDRTRPSAGGAPARPAPPAPAGAPGHPRRRRRRGQHAAGLPGRSGWSAGSSPTPAPTARRATGSAVGRARLADGPRLRASTSTASRSPVVPLGITLRLRWATWRIGHRLGDSISGPRPGRRPDRRRRARLDGPGRGRCSSPPATSWSRSSPARSPSTAATAPDTSPGGAAGRSCSAALLGAPAIAIGSGRAAIWAATLPGVGAGRRRRPAARLVRLWPGRRPGGVPRRARRSTSTPRST